MVLFAMIEIVKNQQNLDGLSIMLTVTNKPFHFACICLLQNKHIPKRVITYTLNDDPQPQVVVAFGLRITN